MENKSWKIKASVTANRTFNPIRAIVDQLNVPHNPNKSLISLSIGDPTKYDLMHPPQNMIQKVIEHASGEKFNGYPHSCGYESARQALAKKYSTEHSSLTLNDVVICSGCSGALDIIISALANEGDNILIPTPGFSLYLTLCASKGIQCKFYHLKPEKNWEADVEEMRSLIDDRTKAVLVNNPSNPCGSAYTRQHLVEIAQLCEEKKVPIIADEIYAGMVFSGHSFHPMAGLVPDVPVLTVGGLAKLFVVPGWRVGWILMHDPKGYMTEVKVGITKLTQLILGANSLAQSVIEEALSTPDDYFVQMNQQLEQSALACLQRLKEIPGLIPIAPQGTMYMMIGIDPHSFDFPLVDSEEGSKNNKKVVDDVVFSRMLLSEEAVVVLPGSCFRMKGFFRIVFCGSPQALLPAFQRIQEFCARHTVHK